MTTKRTGPLRRAARGGRGFGGRLLFAQSMVLIAGAATAAAVAAMVGPPLFREHLRRSGIPAGPHTDHHVQEAYRSGALISASVALAVALLTALVASWYLSGRLGRSIADFSSAAGAIASGRYDHRVESPHLGDDFTALTTAFNQMAAKLESVEDTRRRLFSDLAHEIRTPVSVLEAYTDALEDQVMVLDSKTVAVLRDQARRLVRFSDDFAALAQAEEGLGSITPSWIAPKDIVDEALAAASSRFADKGVTLSADIGPNLPYIWADQHRLGQVLSNLLSNAARYTPPGGKVDVVVHADHDRVVFTVTDNGEGVPAEHLPHLFERFYRVDAARDRQHGGAGIGLAIARAWVEAHGGQITASSGGPGKGARFTFTVPTNGPPTEPQ